MTLKAVHKRRSIQVGAPLSLPAATPQKPAEKNGNWDHPPPKTAAHPEPACNAHKKKRLSASCSLTNRQKNNKNPVVVSPESQTKRGEQVVMMEHLKEEHHAEILRIKTHLNLIHSFNLLVNLSRLTLLSFNSPAITQDAQPPLGEQSGQVTVDLDKSNKDTNGREDDEALEASFYHLALFRFELWLGRIADHLPKSLYKFKRPAQKTNSHFKKEEYDIELTLDYLPPLDVLFVWYSYCLNSRNYYEDGFRLYPILKHLQFPLELAASEYDLFCPKTNVEKLGAASQISEEDAQQLINRIKQLSDHGHAGITLKDGKHFRNPSALLGLLSPKSFNSTAGSNARKLWISLTNTDFNIINFIKTPSFRTFICPQCDDTIESPFYVKDPQTNTVKVTDSCWSYSSPKTHQSPRKSTSSTVEDDHGPGCGQQESQGDHSENPRVIHPVGSHKNQGKLKCMNCDWTGIKQDLSLHKFASEFKFSSEHLCLKTTQDAVNCLAGTLTTLDDLTDTKNAIKFNILFLKEKDELPRIYTEHGRLMDDCLYHLTQIRHSLNLKILNNKLVPTRERFKIKNCFHNLLKSYAVPEPFSVDLIRSMQLETFFIKKMVHLGWTDINPSQHGSQPGKVRASELDGRFQSCLSRYNAFSSLASTINPLQVLIPTFDIDLAWKTDRLRGIEYTESMMQTNKNMISHPNELDLDKSKYLAHFRLTSALWISRYHIEYSRYPAPFVKIDRRQDWLKKATREPTPPPESPSVTKDSSQTGSARDRPPILAATTRSPTSSSTTCSTHRPDNSQFVEHQQVALNPPIISSLEPALLSPNDDHQGDRNDHPQGHSVMENISRNSEKGKQVIKDTSQLLARVDSKIVDDHIEGIKNGHPDKGKQVAQPEDDDSDSSSVATKFSVESLAISDSSPSPSQQIHRTASQQYARKIYLEYTRPTPISAADFTRIQEDVATLVPSPEQPHFSLGSATQSTKIRSDFSPTLTHPVIDETSECNRTADERHLPNQTNASDRQPGEVSRKKEDGKRINSNTAHPPSLNVAGSAQTRVWPGSDQDNHSVPIQMATGKRKSDRWPTGEASLPIHLAPAHVQPRHAPHKTPAAAAPGLHQSTPHRAPTRLEFSPARSPLSKCKFKAAELGDELLDNNFTIPIGKIAFVEEGNRLRCL
ncbi:hypothetical protein PtA15_7A76 [Puccinia triticina]|uniref:Uncharacterized protein n=1 Tax=Puccinia triticina TaxID=208348 RepID=A0ABY7CMQ2_9BASI|nr:uncharacterized protein PtA15_7A76 [Puccinia triticina]WAQ86350.1 hypothetical protein PtA15_7A76 [Puccinia triticina]